MYGIFAYIYHKDQPNVGKYTIHGSYGIYSINFKSTQEWMELLQHETRRVDALEFQKPTDRNGQSIQPRNSPFFPQPNM